MYGAILGDIIGEPYEFEQGPRSKDFPLFCENACCWRGFNLAVYLFFKDRGVNINI